MTRRTALALMAGGLVALGVAPSQAVGAEVNYWRGINPVTELTSDDLHGPAGDRPSVGALELAAGRGDDPAAGERAGADRRRRASGASRSARAATRPTSS